MLMNGHIALFILAAVSAAGLCSAKRFEVPSIEAAPKPKYETLVHSTLLQHQPARLAPVGNPQNAALLFTRTQLKIKDGEYKVKDSYRTASTGVTHVYLKQVVQGLEVTNADISVHVDANGKVITYGDNFYRGDSGAKNNLWNGQSSSRFIKPSSAFIRLANHIQMTVDESKLTVAPHDNGYVLKGVPGARKDVRTQQAYVQTKDGHLEAAWEYFVPLSSNYFHAHVSADGQRVLSLVDWSSSASYNVIKLGDSNPSISGRTLVNNTVNLWASPKGWHAIGEKDETTTTTGNNVDAFASTSDGQYRPTSATRNFDYPLDLTKDPSEYKDASITNLFYMNNIMHDLFYSYGFDEAAGNFQDDNYDKGGEGGDSVEAVAQDPEGVNNAYFQTPPDGERPHMSMFTWATTQPMRDGDLENSIIAHEYGHGITIRLTGGPANSDCLNSREAGGMGEGWSDFFGIWLQLNQNHTRKGNAAVGDYSANRPQGIRKYVYSTDMKTNPTTYGLVHTREWNEAHRIGEIWANILYQLYWNLVEKLGYSEYKYSSNIRKGNTLVLKLVVDGLKLQPCNPSFVDARDAILQAEQLLTGGSNKCEIWKAFAKRGVGVNAKSDGYRTTADTSLPNECNSGSKTSNQ